MIQWMQESGPIFQEFARQNNIRVLNYTLHIFGPTNMEQEEEGQDSEEDEGSEEMDFEE
ncbi:hypothetical protein Gotur_027528, partial [Gossypium turneri]